MRMWRFTCTRLRHHLALLFAFAFACACVCGKYIHYVEASIEGSLSWLWLGSHKKIQTHPFVIQILSVRVYNDTREKKKLELCAAAAAIVTWNLWSITIIRVSHESLSLSLSVLFCVYFFSFPEIFIFWCDLQIGYCVCLCVCIHTRWRFWLCVAFFFVYISSLSFSDK